MSSEYAHNPVDPWSRFVSYCSLVVALGTLAWVYFGDGANRNLPTPDSTSLLNQVNRLFAEESAERKQRDLDMREAWRKQQQEQLAAYKAAADGMLAEHQTLMSELAGQVQPATFTKDDAETESDDSPSVVAADEDATLPLTPATAEPPDRIAEASPKAAPTETPTADGGNPIENNKLATAPNTDPSSDNQDDLMAEDDGLGFTPLLAYVREARRPGSNHTSGLVTVRNRGKGDAIVTKVEFTPSYDAGAVFEVDSAVALVDGDDLEVQSIVFSPQDNQADEKGKHGVYARDLADGLTVLAGQDVRVRLAVSNAKHLGWGFRGSLKINYNGFEPLVIEDAQLVFVGPNDATVQKK